MLKATYSQFAENSPNSQAMLRLCVLLHRSTCTQNEILTRNVKYQKQTTNELHQRWMTHLYSLVDRCVQQRCPTPVKIKVNILPSGSQV